MKPGPEQIKAIVDKVAGSDPDTPWILIVAILVGAGVISWAITKALEATAKKKYRVDHPKADEETTEKQLWWTPMLAVGNIVIGLVIGGVVGGYQWEWVYGALVGAVGGGSPFIPALFKSTMTALAKRGGAKAGK